MNMEEWNELYPSGTAVIWTPDGGVPIETKTTGKATQPGRLAIVRIKDYFQPVWLHRVKPVVEGPTRLTLADLETYLLETNGMEQGQDPVECAISIMETLVKALHERGAIKSMKREG